MTVQEINTRNALRITNAWLSAVQYEAPYFGCGDMEAIKKALEKQIPKKPKNMQEHADGIDTWVTCECGAMKLVNCDEHKQTYCWKCGQLLSLEEGGTSD